jgi:hypothetical protein
LGRPAALVHQNAEQMQRIKMIWLGLENAAIEAFSLPELALSM